VRVLIISDYRDTLALRPEAKQMIGLKRAGVDLDIITYPKTYYEPEFKAAGIRVLTNHPQKKYDREFIRFLIEETKARKYEIFYLFNSQAIINGLQAARHLSVKVILYRGYTGHIHWYDPTAYLKYLHPRVDKVVCLAESIRQLLHRQLFFKKSKAVTINKGHSPEWYEGVNSISLKEFGVPENAFVIACMGNARPFKGIRYLLEATYQLDAAPNLHLLLLGRDMDKGSLRTLIDKSPIADRIHVTGWRSDVLQVLKSCNVFMLPSIGGEATTKSVIEAMSVGLAPVITDIGGNQGLVLDGENGAVVPTKNPTAIAKALLKYYRDPEMTRSHGQKARTHISTHFHINRTVKETLALFEDLIKDQTQ